VPSYDYSDIDRARELRYISRGDVNIEALGCSSVNELRPLVQEQYIDTSNASRLDLQRSLLRKRNAELWQLKVAPLSPGRFTF
jgi:hypothetical protein